MWDRICEKKKLWNVLDSPLSMLHRLQICLDFLVELHVDWSADMLVDLCVDLNVDLGVELAESPIKDLCHVKVCSCLSQLC